MAVQAIAHQEVDPFPFLEHQKELFRATTAIGRTMGILRATGNFQGRDEAFRAMCDAWNAAQDSMAILADWQIREGGAS